MLLGYQGIEIIDQLLDCFGDQLLVELRFIIGEVSSIQGVHNILSTLKYWTLSHINNLRI